MAAKKPGKKQRKAPTEDNPQPTSEFMISVTYDLLVLRSHIFAIEKTMISMASALGMEAAMLSGILQEAQRARLQSYLAAAEDQNPALAARLDSRTLDEI